MFNPHSIFVASLCFSFLGSATIWKASTSAGNTPIPSESAYPWQVERWNNAEIRPDWRGRADAIAHRIKAHRDTYKKTEKATGVPWEVVGVLHNMESGGNFTRHLHEGSPLIARTRYVPKGRPNVGSPPFTWQESAYDALYRLKRMDKYDWSDLGVKLQRIELYNGAGYQKYHKSVPSPYLWSGTTIYTSGKYVADGKWSSTAVSKQVGCACILKLLE